MSRLTLLHINIIGVVVALIVAGVAALALMLFWLGTHDRQGRPGAPYVPAQLRDGRVVPGRSG